MIESFLNLFAPFFGGPQYVFVILLALVKIGIVVGMVQGAVPFIVLFERKFIGWIQERPGPNRVGPWGVLQGIVDGVKLFIKEDFIPKGVDRPLYYAAPTIITVAAMVALCIVPFGPIVGPQDTAALYQALGILNPAGFPQTIPLAITNLNVGVLFVFAVTSMSVYGITLAGWSSNNKWSLLGGVRATAQMISYEITMGLAITSAILVAGSLNLYEIIEQQSGGIQHWAVWKQPIAFLLFVIAGFAETNRLPFDLPEAESELTGGYHTEYSSMKFALFFLSEYMNMIIFASMAATLFLGGYTGIAPLAAIWPAAPAWMGYLLGPVILFAKVFVFIALFVAARAALPRLRYDQLMNFGWKVLLPLGLVNLALVATLMALGVKSAVVYFLCGAAVIVALDQAWRRRRLGQLRARYRYFARPSA